jgi:5,10-methylenetetrahydrofolate reductase
MIPALAKFEPDYLLHELWAGGSTREKSFMVIKRIQGDHWLLAMAHLTCVNAMRAVKPRVAGCQSEPVAPAWFNCHLLPVSTRLAEPELRPR